MRRVAKEQMRPAFGTELWPVHEHVLAELKDNPPDDFYDLRTDQDPPDPDEEDIDRIPLFDPDPEMVDDIEDKQMDAQEEDGYTPTSPMPSEVGTDATTLPAAASRAPGTPVGHLLHGQGHRAGTPPLAQPEPKRQRLDEERAEDVPVQDLSDEDFGPLEQAGLDVANVELASSVAEAGRDRWEVNYDKGLLVRRHLRPRRALYDPCRAQDLPVPSDAISPDRLTVIDMPHGKKKKWDTWTSPNSNVPMDKPWTGATIFKFKKHHSVHQTQAEWQNPQTMSRKDKKALEKELPWSAIPEDQKELYRQALVKEWTTWQKYQAVEVLDKECSKYVEEHIDPARILAASLLQGQARCDSMA